MRNLLLAGALCLQLGVAFAQTAGSITGEVKDQSGADYHLPTTYTMQYVLNIARLAPRLL